MLKYLVALLIIITTGATHAEEEPHIGQIGRVDLPINTMCVNPKNSLTEMVTGKYGEVPFAEGKAMVQYYKTGTWVEVPFTLFVNPAGTTWSLVGFMPGGPACIISSGEGFIPAIQTTY